MGYVYTSKYSWLGNSTDWEDPNSWTGGPEGTYPSQPDDEAIVYHTIRVNTNISIGKISIVPKNKPYYPSDTIAICGSGSLTANTIEIGTATIYTTVRMQATNLKFIGIKPWRWFISLIIGVGDKPVEILGTNVTVEGYEFGLQNIKGNYDLSAYRVHDLGFNEGIIFPEGKNIYFRPTEEQYFSTYYLPVEVLRDENNEITRIPLAQDTLIFDDETFSVFSEIRVAVDCPFPVNIDTRNITRDDVYLDLSADDYNFICSLYVGSHGTIKTDDLAFFGTENTVVSYDKLPESIDRHTFRVGLGKITVLNNTDNRMNIKEVNIENGQITLVGKYYIKNLLFFPFWLGFYNIAFDATQADVMVKVFCLDDYAFWPILVKGVFNCVNNPCICINYYIYEGFSEQSELDATFKNIEPLESAEIYFDFFSSMDNGFNFDNYVKMMKNLKFEFTDVDTFYFEVKDKAFAGSLKVNGCRQCEFYGYGIDTPPVVYFNDFEITGKDDTNCELFFSGDYNILPVLNLIDTEKTGIVKKTLLHDTRVFPYGRWFALFRDGNIDGGNNEGWVWLPGEGSNARIELFTDLDKYGSARIISDRSLNVYIADKKLDDLFFLYTYEAIGEPPTLVLTVYSDTPQKYLSGYISKEIKVMIGADEVMPRFIISNVEIEEDYKVKIHGIGKYEYYTQGKLADITLSCDSKSAVHKPSYTEVPYTSIIGEQLSTVEGLISGYGIEFPSSKYKSGNAMLEVQV